VVGRPRSAAAAADGELGDGPPPGGPHSGLTRSGLTALKGGVHWAAHRLRITPRQAFLAGAAGLLVIACACFCTVALGSRKGWWRRARGRQDVEIGGGVELKQLDDSDDDGEGGGGGGRREPDPDSDDAAQDYDDYGDVAFFDEGSGAGATVGSSGSSGGFDYDAEALGGADASMSIDDDELEAQLAQLEQLSADAEQQDLETI
jgi:hypothetical protein